MALIGSAFANKRRGRHIVTTCFEHSSVHETLLYLEQQGFEVSYLPVDSQGHVSPDVLRNAIREDTILVSVMMVNNEVGAILDVQEISRAVKACHSDIIFHVDAIQAYGKMAITPKKWGIDLLSASGHKIHGPKGTGFLYIGDKVKIHPHIHGGGQQQGLRSGTENVPGIAGIAEAARACYVELDEKVDRLYRLKDRFTEGIWKQDQTVINGRTGRDSAPHIVSVSFAGVRSEVLLHALEEKGIYVSAGSACSSNKPAVSRTLKAMGVEKELLGSTLRFSFSFETTEEEIDHCLGALNDLLPMLRRYVRR